MDAKRRQTSANLLSSSLVGKRLGRYHIEKRLGAGGMGEVYLASDETLHRYVAIKRVASHLGANDPFNTRLIKEAQRASCISDPRIAEVHDVLRIDEEVFLIMEYVEGRRLRDLIKPPIEMEFFYDIAIQCTEALSAAHQNGIVHLDIKPENIVLRPSGQLKILDFGVAKQLPKAASSGTTIESSDSLSFGGTPPYMAPEVLLGESVDFRADLYSLGVIFYEMLVGERPFKGGTAATIIERKLNEDPPELSELAPHYPPLLTSLVMRLLSRDPNARQASAQDLLADLMMARRETPALTRTIQSVRHRRAVRRILPRLAIVLLLIAAVLAVPGIRFRLVHWFGFNSPRIGNHLAILPLQSNERDVELEALCSGLTEELTDAMRRLSTRRSIQLVAAGRVRALRSNSPRKAGDVLGVDYAITGKLDVLGDEWRTTVALLNTQSGETVETRQVRARVQEPMELAQACLEGIIQLLDLEVPRDSLRILLRQDTRSAAAYRFYLQGLGYLQEPQEDINLARRSFLEMHTLDPRSPLAHLGLGLVSRKEFRAGKADSSRKLWVSECDEALSLDDHNIEARLLRGGGFEAAGNDTVALAEYEEALRLDPTDESARTLVGKIYARFGRDDEVERIYKEGIQLQPHFWIYYYRLGYFYYQRGRIEDAMNMFERVRDVVPNYHSGYNALGGIYLIMGRYFEAIPILEQSMRLRPNSGAFTNLGTAYFMQRDYERAIQTYQDAIQLGHADSRMWGNLGDGYYYGPDPRKQQAEESYRHAVGMALEMLRGGADSTLVFGSLAKYHAQLGDEQRALDYLGEAQSRAPENPDLHYTAAIVYMRVGRPAEAMEALRQASAGGYPEAWLRDTPEFDELRQLRDFPFKGDENAEPQS